MFLTVKSKVRPLWLARLREGTSPRLLPMGHRVVAALPRSVIDFNFRQSWNKVISQEQESHSTALVSHLRVWGFDFLQLISIPS